MDIFDAENGKYLRSAYFHDVPYLIKDGKAYYQTGREYYPSYGLPLPPKNEKEIQHPTIEVYRINPGVYDK